MSSKKKDRRKERGRKRKNQLYNNSSYYNNNNMTEKHLSSPVEIFLLEDVSPGLLLASSVHDTKYRKHRPYIGA